MCCSLIGHSLGCALEVTSLGAARAVHVYQVQYLKVVLYMTSSRAIFSEICKYEYRSCAYVGSENDKHPIRDSRRPLYVRGLLQQPWCDT